MTEDEKMAVISSILRETDTRDRNAASVRQGAAFELAMIAASYDDPDRARDIARLLIPEDDRITLARFCASYCRYSGHSFIPVADDEPAELPHAVMIPEITRLDEAVDVLNSKGYGLERLYEDSFAACAEDVEYGRSRYVLMPLSDPSEGRLRSFDKLRDRYGLKIHATVDVPAESGGNYAYQLCGMGYADSSAAVPTRLSVSVDTPADVLSYLNGAAAIGAVLMSAEVSSGEVSRIMAVFDTDPLDERALSALIMYLETGAECTIDGLYAEL